MNAAWNRAFPDIIHDASGRRTLQHMRFGLRALTTPPWAQDIGVPEGLDGLGRVLSDARQPLVVLDLPAGMEPGHAWPHGGRWQERHTRQIPLHKDSDPVEAWPTTRRKQLRRAEREGMLAERCDDPDMMVALHQAARVRKGITSDASALGTLLEELFSERETHGWVVRNADDKVLAGGVFHGAGDGRCIYGFGGQHRTDQPGDSSRASILMIAAAMREAATLGAGTFDFGGSMDQGVDRFYAEFGADKVPKYRLVRIAPVWRPLFRLARPDLFKD